ncbi:MAG: tol-pal system protein YbgF [Rickettsia endosymbiont of Ixodes persulcatus]|nr:tol-pal system protein YbgF [Rickettsia endosymbiont of Ixodes persulcatus]MCZ6902868.1 tol-pal system protein YbgF [Rickettsia endosymbiont of Ixodes persulcatus]MCZ6909093.1 tol-pal system protein YbgF [Rickettsia endosymbiont of Ixodes persulcatus]MCZ6909772.1 tol-pal system protein YbgF [Rickettsia endosymbiont of Ixodes persulcatus]MCZ6913558.1 tol-pal system protein YbgF [Rickettsia endosymbiont of Ixodes persulcatus]
MKLIILLFTFLFSMVAFGESETIKGKPLKYAANNDFENRLDEQEQEIRRLIGKVEVLQHKIDMLTQNSNIPNQEENTEISEGHNSKSQDVFDVALLKDTPDTASKKPITVNKDIALDKQAYDLALAAYKDNKLTEAKDKLKNFIQKYPNSSLISNAYFWYGECFFKQKDYNGAAVNYLKGYKELPKGAKSSDGLLKLALSLGELKKTQEACNMLAKLNKEFPTNRTAASKKMTEDAKVKFGCKNK